MCRRRKSEGWIAALERIMCRCRRRGLQPDQYGTESLVSFEDLNFEKCRCKGVSRKLFFPWTLMPWLLITHRLKAQRAQMRE